MPLIEIDELGLSAPVSDQAERLIAKGESRILEIGAAHRNTRLPAFVPADYRAVFLALQTIEADKLAPNRRFCEWGSGLGIVAMLAQQLGFEAVGIEIERELVAASNQLATEAKSSACFVHGTFIPEAVEHLADTQDDLATLGRGIADGYDELGLDADDFGLIYAYPWPGEEAAIESVFEAVAARGALLLTYRSTEDLVLQRKV